MNKLTNMEKDILRTIGYYFLNKNSKEDLDTIVHEAMKIVNDLGIKQIVFNEESNVLSISLSRPGLLIGKQGSIVNGLQDELSEEFKRKITIDVEESHIDEYLYAFTYVLRIE